MSRDGGGGGESRGPNKMTCMNWNCMNNEIHTKDLLNSA